MLKAKHNVLSTDREDLLRSLNEIAENIKLLKSILERMHGKFAQSRKSIFILHPCVVKMSHDVNILHTTCAGYSLMTPLKSTGSFIIQAEVFSYGRYKSSLYA